MPNALRPAALASTRLPETHAAWREYVLIGEGTHTVLMEKNRLQFFAAVQSFLEAR